MKKHVILYLIIGLINTLCYAGKLSRGPEEGELYFLRGHIFHSWDYGQTVETYNTNPNDISRKNIAADRTPGSVYLEYSSMGGFFKYSSSYGQDNSFEVIQSDIYGTNIHSGRLEGEVFFGPWSHSNNYGFGLIWHELYPDDWWIYEASEIDVQDSIGYVLTSENNSLYFYRTYDNFDTLELIDFVFDDETWRYEFARGSLPGELYLYTSMGGYRQQLWFSNDFGETWEFKHLLSSPSLPVTGITGGWQSGEVILSVPFYQNGHTHLYFYHSRDYGETFDIYHPISNGPEPTIAHFDACPLSGPAPLTVRFRDLSTGNNANSWNWDFNNDIETFESHEQNPEYTFQDTGYYSISMAINPYTPELHAYRENYIHVTSSSSSIEQETGPLKSKYEIDVYPNPFLLTASDEKKRRLTIKYNCPRSSSISNLDIFNLKGQKIKDFPVDNDRGSISWDGKDYSGYNVGTGIYFIKFRNIQNSIKKIMIIK